MAASIGVCQIWGLCLVSEMSPSGPYFHERSHTPFLRALTFNTANQYKSTWEGKLVVTVIVPALF